MVIVVVVLFGVGVAGAPAADTAVAAATGADLVFSATGAAATVDAFSDCLSLLTEDPDETELDSEDESLSVEEEPSLDLVKSGAELGASGFLAGLVYGPGDSSITLLL